MFLALLHTSSRYQLRYTRQHKCATCFFCTESLCETNNSNYGSEIKFAHWAGSWFFHIESYYSQQIKGGSSPEDPGLNHQNYYKTCQSFQMHHVEKRLPPCEQNVSTKFFTSALPLFFGVSAFRHLLDMIHRQESKESMILLGALKILKITKKSIYIYSTSVHSNTWFTHINTYHFPSLCFDEFP